MPRLSERSLPAYRLHRQSGQAVVTLNGRDYLLGHHGTVASKKEYDRIIGEWLAAGRRAPEPGPIDLTIADLVNRYLERCDGYYRRLDGTPTSEVSTIEFAMKPLTTLYSASSAKSFGPLALKAVRGVMVDKGWSRGVVNKAINRIRGMFRWGVENELVEPAILQALRAVEGLKRGRCEAREPEPIQPVEDAVVEATIPHLSTIIGAMVRIQRLTGCRPGEVCRVTTATIDQSTAVWTFKPTEHKNSHRGKPRLIFIGPQAQTILRPFLMPLNPTAMIFCPRRAAEEMRAARHDQRKTPAGYGNGIGTNRKAKPSCLPGVQYDVNAYRRAIERACDKAFPIPADLAADPVKAADWQRAHRWQPNQLRHSAATEIRRRFGIEAASTILGHAELSVTQVYAEADRAAASAVMSAIG